MSWSRMLLALAAARYYAYTTLAAWQVNALCEHNTSANQVLSQLRQYPQLGDLR
jgi:cytochrome oxidase assembly protein ShyY1